MDIWGKRMLAEGIANTKGLPGERACACVHTRVCMCRGWLGKKTRVTGAESALGQSRRGWVKEALGEQLVWSVANRCEDLGSYSEWDEKPPRGFWAELWPSLTCVLDASMWLPFRESSIAGTMVEAGNHRWGAMVAWTKVIEVEVMKSGWIIDIFWN